MGRVVVIGSSNTDLVSRAARLPSAGETVFGTAFAVYPGGKGANQAVAARRAGAEVRFVGAIGDDAFGAARRDELAAEGIDLTYLTEIPEATSGVAQIVVDFSGENQIVVVPGSNDLVQPEQSVAAVSAGFDVLSAVLEVAFDAIRAGFIAPRTGLALLNAAPFDPRVIEILGSVDILICNESEASAILGYAVEASDVAGAATAAMQLLAFGPRTAIITIGPAGAVVADEAGVRTFPAPTVDVVDTTGAGDCFCGVLAAWLADGASLDDAVAAAVVAGSLAVTVPGAQPSMPERAAIVTAMSERGLM
ncbi:MAG TPA: ribokinase [Thermomicrobiales bacterium]|nr:ribokinase [Chloroflexota bacterium]HCG28545.1 ribokinase [Chloroflexota bacterium]HQZ90094.1 ribokinase [Thermomicrobiales bacterium]HRA32708.1 ribokinase [Thermomicrobiales bacterium]